MVGDNVSVCVRVRPLLGKEGQCGERSIVSIVGNTVVLEHPEDRAKQQQFTFDVALDSTVANDAESFASQEVVWNHVGSPLMESALEGFNVSLLAYGQTGSGKREPASRAAAFAQTMTIARSFEPFTLVATGHILCLAAPAIQASFPGCAPSSSVASGQIGRIVVAATSP